MIKGAKNIAQFKILEWVNDYFESDSVEVTFDNASRATVTDEVGGSMKVEYIPGRGIRWEVIK